MLIRFDNTKCKIVNIFKQFDTVFICVNGNIMRNKHKESDLILEFQIQEQMENSFKTIHEKNTAGD